MKLGIYQCVAAGRSQAERLEVLERYLKEQSLDLLVCPELFASGYHVGADIQRLAEPQAGPFGQKIAALAQQYACAIAFGYPERAGDVIYNSVAVYDACGQGVAHHRKRLPSPGSFEAEAFASGDEVTIFDLGDWRIAVLICYEVEFPESLRQAALGGAHLVIVPTALGADWGIVAEKLIGTRAYENGIWIAYADHAGHENGADYYGGSRIAAPDGAEPAVAGQEECLISATLDRETVERMQKRLPFLSDCARL